MNNEASIQSLVRLEARQFDCVLFRNNVGVLRDARGVPVRFGLANDSKALNEVLKSADLIGWRTITVTPDMIGKHIAQFVSRECKAAGWVVSQNNAHEAAQLAWAQYVNAHGGDAKIISGPGSFLS